MLDRKKVVLEEFPDKFLYFLIYGNTQEIHGGNSQKIFGVTEGSNTRISGILQNFLDESGGNLR